MLVFKQVNAPTAEAALYRLNVGPLIGGRRAVVNDRIGHQILKDLPTGSCTVSGGFRSLPAEHTAGGLQKFTLKFTFESDGLTPINPGAPASAVCARDIVTGHTTRGKIGGESNLLVGARG